MHDYLLNELARADDYYNDAVAAEVDSGYDPDATMERQYWAGYVDAINNVINEYAGPGDTN